MSGDGAAAVPSPALPAPSIPWMVGLPPRPLCDVPWLGRSVVLSDGNVNFCCFSDAVVGNVNERSLTQIWRGPQMQLIRDTLAKQRFPQECRSNSCPLFRGDEHTYLLDRMDGAAHGADEEQARLRDRERLRASRIDVEPERPRRGDVLRATLRLVYAGDWLAADLFVAMRRPDGSFRFLPGLEEFPLPFRRRIELSAGRGPLDVPLGAAPVDRVLPCGDYELCAALFDCDASPWIASACRFVLRRPVTIES